MQILCFTVGSLNTNCYLVTAEDSPDTLIIDPGDDADFLTSEIQNRKLHPTGIILTHGHYDHCLGVSELVLNFRLPILLHKMDLSLYQKSSQRAKHFSGIVSTKPIQPNMFIKDGDKIAFGQELLTVIHTPGHTPGSICLLGKSDGLPTLFTGDTLFQGGVGNTEHQYSSSQDLQKSIKKINSLPQETFLYPGHENYGVELKTVLFPS